MTFTLRRASGAGRQFFSGLFVTQASGQLLVGAGEVRIGTTR